MISKIGIVALLAVILSPLYAYAVPASISLEIDGTSYDIDYDAEGMTIIGIEADLNEIELIIEVDVTESPGILEITFDRIFFDATFEGEDDEFFVIADGDFVDVQEESNPNNRTLRIELPLGTEEVEIFGTKLVGTTFEQPQPEVMEEQMMEEEPEVMEEEPEVMEEEPEVMEEEMMEEKPKTQCGPGTILKDGVCVLEEQCGPGTHLEDGVCVLDEKAVASFWDRPTSTQLIYGAAAAFIIAFIIIFILWIISVGSRQKKPIANQ